MDRDTEGQDYQISRPQKPVSNPIGVDNLLYQSVSFSNMQDYILTAQEAAPLQDSGHLSETAQFKLD